MSIRRITSTFLLAIFLGFSGCGDDGPKVVPVHGKLTYKGKPVANLDINFKPDFGRTSWAKTDADGEFIVRYSKAKDGAVVGKHAVWFVYKPGDPNEEMRMLAEGAASPAEFRELLDKHGSEDTALAIEVPENGGELPIDVP